MTDLLQRIGARTLERLAKVGQASVMWALAIWGLPRRGDFALLVRQIYSIGVLSLIIIVLSAFSIGSVIALQFYTQLARFGAEDAVGLGLALVLLRELGPVVTGLLFAGRAGSSFQSKVHVMVGLGSSASAGSSAGKLAAADSTSISATSAGSSASQGSSVRSSNAKSVLIPSALVFISAMWSFF